MALNWVRVHAEQLSYPGIRLGLSKPSQWYETLRTRYEQCLLTSHSPSFYSFKVIRGSKRE